MQFRLIVDGRHGGADGAWNMAVDEALLESAMKPGAIPTLRLYHFHRPTVTFGYGQEVAQAVNEAGCRDRRVEWVRRITGGRALLHQHELTYSVAAPPFTRSVKSAYQAVTGALRSALERLGVPVDPPGAQQEVRGVRGVRAPGHLPCLAVPTGQEITAGGLKVVASAMRFRRRGFLQHGSILWSIDRRLSKQVTGLGEQEPLTAVGLQELDAVNAPAFGEAELVEALSSAFEELLGAPATPGALSPEESQRVSNLVEKYRSEGWTSRRDPGSHLVDNSEAVWLKSFRAI